MAATAGSAAARPVPGARAAGHGRGSPRPATRGAAAAPLPVALSLLLLLGAPAPAPAAPAPPTPYQEQSAIEYGLDYSQRIRGCPNANPNCVSTSSRAGDTYSAPWRAPEGFTAAQVADALVAYISGSMPGAEVEAREAGAAGAGTEYLRMAVPSPVWGTDRVEFLAKVSLPSRRRDPRGARAGTRRGAAPPRTPRAEPRPDGAGGGGQRPELGRRPGRGPRSPGEPAVPTCQHVPPRRPGVGRVPVAGRAGARGGGRVDGGGVGVAGAHVGVHIQVTRCPAPPPPGPGAGPGPAPPGGPPPPPPGTAAGDRRGGQVHLARHAANLGRRPAEEADEGDPRGPGLAARRLRAHRVLPVGRGVHADSAGPPRSGRRPGRGRGRDCRVRPPGRAA